MLVDSHCHLDRLDLSKYTNGLADAVAAAKAQGVEEMLCVCISQENKSDVLAIAREYPGIYASVGVHPSDVDPESVVDVETLISWAEGEKVIALGETGLDYHYSEHSAHSQKQSFANHLIAGGRLGLPVIIHTRNAKEDTLSLMSQHASREHAGVMHCFTEDWEMAQAALAMNFYISISGIVTFKNAEQLRDVAKRVPEERLLIETDSPYLAPVPHRGKPNEPRYVREVAEFVASLRGQSFESLAEQTTKNFAALFSSKQRWQRRA